jgi:hypothetical protein
VQRRDFLLSSLLAALSGTAVGCAARESGTSATTGRAGGLAERFAIYPVADEPNGDLAKVAWPSFVTDAGPEVKGLYEWQITHGELARYMPCFCGCGQTAGHMNNRDCYVQEVKDDGSVVLDSMAPTWDICLGVTRAVMNMHERGMSARGIRAAIDARYINLMDKSTPTPYPPASSG